MKTRTKWGAAVSSALLAATLFPAAGLAGTSTTDVANSSIVLQGLSEGDTVTAYQVFDADIDGANNLTYTAAKNLPADYATVDKLSALSTDDAKKAAADAYASAFTSGSATVPSNHTATAKADEKGNATLDLDSGYWVAVVTSTSGVSKVFQPKTIDATPEIVNGKYQARVLRDQPVKSSDEQISKFVGDNGAKSVDSYTVGQSVPFKVTTNVPNYPANSKTATFAINDAPTAGLSINTDSVTVTVGTETVWQNGAAVNAADFNSNTTKIAATGYTFDFAKNFVLSHPGQDVVVTYNATLTSAAFANTKDGVTGNTAKITFNPNPYADSTVEPSDSTTVQTYGYVFHKTDKGGNALEGATFTLYDAQDNVVKKENGDPLTSTSTKVGDKAYVYFEDLGAGKYTAKETTVPSGKQKAQDISFTVGAVNAKADNPATDVTETNYLVNDADVVDPDQPLLPVTGDTGTFLLTLGGVVLVSASAALYARSRRKER